jgi:hypothetical protein
MGVNFQYLLSAGFHGGAIQTWMPFDADCESSACDGGQTQCVDHLKPCAGINEAEHSYFVVAKLLKINLFIPTA